MKDLLARIFGSSVNRYFWFGMKYGVRFQSAFAREIALEQAMNYVRHHGLPGDYLEFGVFEGRTFGAAVSLAQERSLNMHFWAFDSFEGLPAAEGEFGRQSWKSGRDVFLHNVERRVRDPLKLHLVTGWFAETLREDNPVLHALENVAIAWVDCDLYESTVPVLNFLTNRLQDGSLIYFDDWFCFKGRPDRGEQRACHEWLKRSPHLRLTPYTRFGWHGQSFLVHRDDGM
jgi:O-methyltransferase